MKKFILISCIILLTSISYLFALEEFSTEPISLDEFIEEYIPDYTLQKQIPLEGIGRAYAVAKDSGNVVAITEIGDQFKVHYFDIEGNLKWTKIFDKVELYGSFHKVKSMDCEISDNGETICLYITPQLKGDPRKPTGFYGVINTILSKKGDVLFTKTLGGTRLIPSPDGKYLYKSTGVVGGQAITEFELYNTDGSLANIKGFDTKDIINIRLKFVSNDYILACILKKIKGKYSNYLQFLKFENETITPLWEYELDRQNLSGNFHEKVKVADDKIAIGGTNASSKFYVFDYEGNLLQFEDTVCRSFDFVNDDELFLQTYTAKGKYSKLINLATKEVRKEDIIFYYEGRYEDFEKAFEFDKLLLFSIKRHPRQNFSTLILHKDNWWDAQYLLHHNVDYIIEGAVEYLLFEKYFENPEIIIMQGGER